MTTGVSGTDIRPPGSLTEREGRLAELLLEAGGGGVVEGYAGKDGLASTVLEVDATLEVAPM